MTSARIVALGTLAVGVILALGQVAGAATERRQGPQKDVVERRLDHMRKRLGLTDEQAAKVEAILRERQKHIDEARAHAAGNRREAHRLARESRWKADEDIAAVLNEEQKAKFQEMKTHRRERTSRRPPEGPPS